MARGKIHVRMGGSVVDIGKFGSVENYLKETSKTAVNETCYGFKTKCVFVHSTIDSHQYDSVSNIASRIRIASGIWNFSYCKATGRLHVTVSTTSESE